MTEKIRKSGNEKKKKSAKPRRKPRGRKLASPAKKRKVAPGQGATRLRSSINSLVSQESDRIAQALIDKTIAGNMTGARLLVELSGAKHPPAEPEEESGISSLIAKLANGPQWVDPESNEKDASKLPYSEPDEDLDENPALPAPKPDF